MRLTWNVWLSWIGIAAAIIGFFTAPVWLGILGAVLGIISFSGPNKGWAWVALVLGIVVLVLGIW